MSSAEPRAFKPYPKYKDSGVEWLGEIPAHWEARRIKHVAPVLTNRVPNTVADLPYVDLEHIESETGRLIGVGDSAADETQDPGVHFVAGDVLFGKLRPYLAKVVRAEFEGSCSSELLVLRSGGAIAPEALAYQLRSSGFIRFVSAMTYGTKMPRANPEQISGMAVVVAPPEEQHAIAAFLDRETARIDSLVAKKERLIELLKEKRAALITHAVTKGLDPNVPMKHSGVEWLGEIPAHWEVKPLTRSILEMSDYRGQTPEKVASGARLVTARNIRMGRIDYECSEEYVAEDQYEEIMRRGLPKSGDILLTTEAPLGNVALVDREDVALAQRIIRFRMDPRHFRGQFALSAMMSAYFQAQLASLSTGSTAEGLKASKLPMLRLAAPPADEQGKIASALDRDVRAMSTLMTRIQDAIVVAKELRAALISAAVIGKIDVRGEAA